MTTSESKPGTTESSTQTTVSSSETTTVPQETTTTAETSSATATTEKSQPSETSTSATATTASSAKPSETTTESTVLASIFGDINLDSKVDITDAVLLNKKAANAVDFNAQQLLNGDCYDQNGEIDGNDATALLKFLVHIIKALPETSDLNA